MKRNDFARIREGVKAVRFCKWFAEVATDEDFDNPADSATLVELALRKLSNLGYVEIKGDYWALANNETPINSDTKTTEVKEDD